MKILMKPKCLMMAWICAVMLGTLSCSSDCTGEGSSQATMPQTEYEWNDTQAVIETSGGSGVTFSVEVDDSAIGWCWLAAGSPLKGLYNQKAGRSVTLYLKPNNGRTDRRAEVSLLFSDGGHYTLTLTQRCTEPSASEPDETAHGAWAELPQFVDNDAYVHKTYFTTLSDKRTVRNYSVCFDTEHKVSRWVAYPVHTVYTTGRDYPVSNNTAGRTDAWAFDDAVTEYSSSNKYNILSKYDESTGAYDTATEPIIRHSLQQNVASGAYNDREENKSLNLQRGHMLPSASRYNSWQTNAQTFYATNIMPQNGTLNGGVWGDVEIATRNSVCADTLYVVVGTLFEDGARRITARNRDITVPSHCYKLLLRTRSGNTGKRISDITSADELLCIGFLFENGDPKGVTMSSSAVSVAEIEKRSGFSFFDNLDPSIAAQVKSQCRLSDWSAFK